MLKMQICVTRPQCVNNVRSAQRLLSVQMVGGIGNVNPQILISAVAGGGWGWQLNVQACRRAVAVVNN